MILESVRLEVPDKKFGYYFQCFDGKKHRILCEDWELGELYRKCENYRKEGKYKDENEVFEKVKQKMLGELPSKRNLYFVVGTHFRFPTFMIVGLVYPKKSDEY